MRAIGLALLLALAATAGAHPKKPADAQGLDAHTALDRLMQGNQRKVSGQYRPRALDPDKRSELDSGQWPIAAVVACSDSRMGPELLFDQGRGDLFVVRLAGNVVSEDGLASLEYAVDHLHVPLIVVLGHERCGAVGAALAHDRHYGNLGALLARIGAHLHERGKPLALAKAVEENVRESAREIERGSAVLSAAVLEGRLTVVCGVATLADGRVDLVMSPGQSAGVSAVRSASK